MTARLAKVAPLLMLTTNLGFLKLWSRQCCNTPVLICAVVIPR